MLVQTTLLTVMLVLTAIGPAMTDSVRAQSLESRVEAYLKSYLETGNFSGSILIAKEGQIILSKGYGLADHDTGTPNGPETVYHLASVSRIFTSAAIVLLEQQGKLSVDDPLSKYLPEWPRGDEITIHHLLTLSAGFPNINSMPGYFFWQQSQQTPESLVEKFRDLPLEFEPGTRTVHSNSNYNVLALLIERISGRSYGTFLEDEILVPLQMHQTAHHASKDQAIPHEAIGYAPAGLADVVPAPLIDWSVKTGNGSMYSTTEDLYRLDRDLVHLRLFRYPAKKKLFTEHFPNNGYGWFLDRRFGTKEIYINGGSPGFGSFWGRSADNDVTVIVLGNMYNNVPNTIGRDLIAMVMGEAVEPPPILREPPDPALLAELIGTYQFGPDFYNPNGTVNVTVQDGHLFNGSHWLMPTATGKLHFVHRRYWSDLVFHRGDDGKIVELRYDRYVGKKK